MIAAFRNGVVGLKGTKCLVIGITSNIVNLSDRVETLASAKVVFGLATKNDRRLQLLHYLGLEKLEDPIVLDKLVESTANWSSGNLAIFIEKVVKYTKIKEDRCIKTQIIINVFNEMRDLMKGKYKDFQLELPTLKLTDNFDYSKELIALTPAVKSELDMLGDFLMHPDTYKNGNSLPNRNLLLYGPPGTGKTSFAKAVANHCNALVIIVDAGKYKSHGGTEKLISIFAIAKSFEKAIVFIDEMDAVTTEDSPAREALQTEIDGFLKSLDRTLVVIGATNYRERIAGAIQDRFTPVEINLPDLAQRQELFIYYLNKNNHLQFGADLRDDLCEKCLKFARLTDGYSHRRIGKLIEKAAMTAIYEANQKKNTNQKPTLKREHMLATIANWGATRTRADNSDGNDGMHFSNWRQQTRASRGNAAADQVSTVLKLLMG